jgi:hypothetical protein
VLVGGSDLLDLDEVSVARTVIAHAGGVGFRRLALTEGKGAAPVRSPGAVIVTDDGLRLAVAESDTVDGHGSTSPEGGCGPAKTKQVPILAGFALHALSSQT